MKNNISVGVDIEDIKRFELDKNKKKDAAFLENVFSDKELEYCFSKPKPAQHLAARFCAKEALIKAFSSRGKKIDYKEIEVLRDEKGVPRVQNISDVDIQISMSHTTDKAIAFALCIF